MATALLIVSCWLAQATAAGQVQFGAPRVPPTTSSPIRRGAAVAWTSHTTARNPAAIVPSRRLPPPNGKKDAFADQG